MASEDLSNPTGAEDLAASAPSEPPAEYKPPRPQPGSAEDALIGRKVGPCRVDSLLGQGGMGAVYKAHHIALDRPVALKVIAPDWLGTPAAAAAFLQEARIAARLEDPRIVQVYDVGVHGEQTYIVMQLVAGETLEARVTRQGPLKPEEALRVVKEAAKALAAAHKQGVVHRDVKPANIIISPDGSVRLMDFGLSVMAGRSEAHQEGLSTMGSFDFMAPEQGFGAPPDPRMDIYALGATYFYALAGRPPYLAKNAGDMLLQHREAQIPDVRVVCRGATAAAADLIRKCMSKKPAGRPAGANHLLQELDNPRMLLDVDPSGSPFQLLPAPVEETHEGFDASAGFTPHAADEAALKEPDEGEAAPAPGAVRPPLAGGAPVSSLPAGPALPENRPLVVKVVSGAAALALLARLWRQTCGADLAAASFFAAAAAAYCACQSSWRTWVRGLCAGLGCAAMAAGMLRFGLGAFAIPAQVPELEALILWGLGLAAAGAGFYLGVWAKDRRVAAGLILGSGALLLPAALSLQAPPQSDWSAAVKAAAAQHWARFAETAGPWRWGAVLALCAAGVFFWRRHAVRQDPAKGPLLNWNR